MSTSIARELPASASTPHRHSQRLTHPWLQLCQRARALEPWFFASLVLLAPFAVRLWLQA